MENNSPTYVRLLGCTQTGRAYLKEKKQMFTLPIISKVSSFQNTQISLDIKAATIYALGLPLAKQNLLLELEYNQPPIMK
jgi:hypothetical protein